MTIAFVVVTLGFFALLLGGLGYALLKAYRTQAAWIGATRRALAEGVPGSAIITSMGPSPLGKLVVRLQLDVQTERGAAYSTTLDAFVPHYAAAAFEPGKQVRVRCIASERMVAIDFPAMGYAAPPGW